MKLKLKLKLQTMMKCCKCLAALIHFSKVIYKKNLQLILRTIKTHIFSLLKSHIKKSDGFISPKTLSHEIEAHVGRKLCTRQIQNYISELGDFLFY